MHIYQKWALPFLEKGLPTIPDKYGSKLPAVRQWNSTLVDEKQILEWTNGLKESNIALLTGESSGIIALDFDCTDEAIIEKIEHMMPKSPVERRGAKGWVRFFRYSGESSFAVKAGGEVVFEILSNNKKVTLPPSKHPSGLDYKWVNEVSLLDVAKCDLPVLPPMLIPHIESHLRLNCPEAALDTKTGKLVSGRNDELSSLCGRLISENTPLDTAVRLLIEHDEKHHEKPLFSDTEEFQHSERFTNATLFYVNHLNSVNGRRFRKNETYEIPITASAVNRVHVEEIQGKSEPQKVSQEKLSYIELPTAKGLLGKIHEHILENSFIPQPEFAFSAALALMSVLISRKLIFETASPNLYLLNIGPSGCGKDAPQQILKDLLLRINADHLLGAGDYVSDASLTDGLEMSPTRLDIIDECGGLLKNVNSGGATYNTKMADILCELYTSSNNKYLGRAVAEGRKGACVRPNVVLLGSTTPTGFKEGVTMRAIEKGLMGRMLVFQGRGGKKAARVKSRKMPSKELLEGLSFWANYKPAESSIKVAGISQEALEVFSSEEASERLTEIFEEFDSLRRELPESEPTLPIISRLYQQMGKIALLHAASRQVDTDLKVEKEDVDFAYQTIQYYHERIGDFIRRNVFKSKSEELLESFLDKIREYGKTGVAKHILFKEYRGIDRRWRENLVSELVEGQEVYVSVGSDGQEVLIAI